MDPWAPIHPYGYTLFCDDIREEITGKTTYVGTYKGFLYTAIEEPVVLPKLAFAITIKDPTKKLFNTLELQIYNTDQDTATDDPIAGHTMNREQLTILHEDGITGSEADTIAVVHFKAEISPFPLLTYGRINVRALWDDTLIKLGSLVVAPPPDRETG